MLSRSFNASTGDELGFGTSDPTSSSPNTINLQSKGTSENNDILSPSYAPTPGALSVTPVPALSMLDQATSEGDVIEDPPTPGNDSPTPESVTLFGTRRTDANGSSADTILASPKAAEIGVRFNSSDVDTSAASPEARDAQSNGTQHAETVVSEHTAMVVESDDSEEERLWNEPLAASAASRANLRALRALYNTYANYPDGKVDS